MQVRFIEKISQIPSSLWDGLMEKRHVFTSHAFLAALEESGSVAPKTGWQPHHLALYDHQETLIGAIPCYLKMHSFGEYVFDHHWARIWIEAGGHYYPKLFIGVPFSPVTGPRFLTRRGQDIKEKMMNALIEECKKYQLSSLHIVFADQEAIHTARHAECLIRAGHQFHWYNHCYRDFDQFLEAFSSRKRKSIRKERSKLREEKIHFRKITGKMLDNSEIWDFFYLCYGSTYERKFGQPYLSRAFFDQISVTLRESILLVLAENARGVKIASALNFMDEDILYGRNWGCLQSLPYLHFETCYYQAIEFALEHNFSRVEAGTQGAHKLQRGYEPVITYSAHYLPHNEFRKVIANFLEHEASYEAELVNSYRNDRPFRNS